MFNLEFAEVVLEKFASGKPVSESLLVKVSEDAGVSSKEVLIDARFRTKLSNYIKTGGEMSRYQKEYYAVSAGFEPYTIEKIAQITGESYETTVMLALYQNDFIPDVEKIAEAGLEDEDVGGTLQQDPSAIQGLSPDNIPQITNPAAMTSQDGNGQQMVQPTPQSPSQVPEMSQGNGEQLQENFQNKDQIEAQQQEQANQQMLEQNPQPQAPKEQIEASLAQASPEDKAKYISPSATPEQLQRISQEISKIEQQVGMPIKDPAQLKKIVAGVEKLDKKVIDDAIKQQYSGGSEEPTGPLPGSPETQQGGGGMPPSPQPQVDTQKIASHLKRMRANFYI